MTTYVGARDALTSYIETNLGLGYPTMPRFWENTLQVNLESLQSPFVKIEIVFQDTVQLTVNDDPIDQDVGIVAFELFYKEGEGTRAGLAVFDFIKSMMKHKTIGGVTTYTPKPGRIGQGGGWRSSQINVPFSFDSLP